MACFQFLWNRVLRPGRSKMKCNNIMYRCKFQIQIQVSHIKYNMWIGLMVLVSQTPFLSASHFFFCEFRVGNEGKPSSFQSLFSSSFSQHIFWSVADLKWPQILWYSLHWNGGCLSPLFEWGASLTPLTSRTLWKKCCASIYAQNLSKEIGILALGALGVGI